MVLEVSACSDPKTWRVVGELQGCSLSVDGYCELTFLFLALLCMKHLSAVKSSPTFASEAALS